MFRSVLPRILIIVGIVMLAYAGWLSYERFDTSHLSFTKIDQTKINVSKITPVGIKIPGLSISLKILPAAINNNQWETTTDGVSYITSTPVPGDLGNSVIYGHDFTNLFGKLPRIKPGDKVDIYLSDGTTRGFTVRYTQVVTPDETHILSASPDRRLTLYTCTGWFDTRRFVAVATLN